MSVITGIKEGSIPIEKVCKDKKPVYFIINKTAPPIGNGGAVLFSEIISATTNLHQST